MRKFLTIFTITILIGIVPVYFIQDAYSAGHITHCSGTEVLVPSANTVDSTKVINDGLGNEDYAPNSITTTEIRDGTVALIDMNSNSVDSTKIKNSSVSNADLRNDAVTGAKIQASAIDSTDIKNDSIGNEDIVVNGISTTEIRDGTIALIDMNTDSIDSTKVKNTSLALDDINFNSIYPLSLWAVPDTINSGDDAITVKALSDTTLNSGQNNYIFCYGDGDGTDDYALFSLPVSFNFQVPDTLVAYVKFSESDSCDVSFMLRQRQGTTTVYMDTTLVNPTGFSDDTWTRVSMLFGEYGYATVPQNTILDLILKVQCETDETVSVTNVIVK